MSENIVLEPRSIAALLANDLMSQVETLNVHERGLLAQTYALIAVADALSECGPSTGDQSGEENQPPA